MTVLACFIQKKKKQNCSEVSHPRLHQGITLDLPPDPQPQSLLALPKTDAPIFFLYSPLSAHSKPVNEWHAIALTHALTYQYLFRHATVICAKLYMTY